MKIEDMTVEADISSILQAVVSTTASRQSLYSPAVWSDYFPMLLNPKSLPRPVLTTEDGKLFCGQSKF